MKIFTYYYQFGIWDVANSKSYPVPNGEDLFVKGKNGFTVLLNQEKEIDFLISNSTAARTPFKLYEFSFAVGNSGIQYGNIPAATVGSYNLPEGHHKFILFADHKDQNDAKFFQLKIEN
jgi:hypothetical protein